MLVNVDVRPGAGVDVVADAGRLPFKSGAFGDVTSFNPYKYQPVSAETARVLSPGGTLRVTVGPNNPYGVVTAAEAKGAGFQLVSSGPSTASEMFGTMRGAVIENSIPADESWIGLLSSETAGRP